MVGPPVHTKTSHSRNQKPDFCDLCSLCAGRLICQKGARAFAILECSLFSSMLFDDALSLYWQGR